MAETPSFTEIITRYRYIQITITIVLLLVGIAVTIYSFKTDYRKNSEESNRQEYLTALWIGSDAQILIKLIYFWFITLVILLYFPFIFAHVKEGNFKEKILNSLKT
jgi:uncharacterized membrane protein YwaF